jgi:hypothetical protein
VHDVGPPKAGDWQPNLFDALAGVFLGPIRPVDEWSRAVSPSRAAGAAYGDAAAKSKLSAKAEML